MRRPQAGFAVVAAALLAAHATAGRAQNPVRPAVPPGGTRWVIDIAHSQIDFRVRHLVGRVRGTFTNWYAVILTDDQDWRHGKVNVTVQTTSLSTGNNMRDADLKSRRFFDVDSFPEMTFLGTGIAASDTTVEIIGLLTIKGQTHPANLRGTYRGIARDDQGHERIAFEASVALDRRDFGINWNANVGGGTLIGNEVEISISLEAVRVN